MLALPPPARGPLHSAPGLAETPRRSRRAPRRTAAPLPTAGEGAEDREALFTLLSHCLGWIEAAEAVEEVLRRFGCLAEAIAAEEAELAALPALGEAGAAALKAVHAAALRIDLRRRDRPVLRDTDAALAYLRDAGALPAEGELCALFLDARHGLVADELVCCAAGAAAPGQVLRRALALRAAAVLLVRGGDPAAVAAEAAMARAIAQAGRVMDVHLADHVVVGRGGHASLRAQGLMEVPGAA
nr:JAB domain-containing protein [Neoroseomonas eburnea]